MAKEARVAGAGAAVAEEARVGDEGDRVASSFPPDGADGVMAGFRSLGVYGVEA